MIKKPPTGIISGIIYSKDYILYGQIANITTSGISGDDMILLRPYDPAYCGRGKIVNNLREGVHRLL